ncbi:prolyl oligopeptidase family serine peptidase [candidate division KSB1 bacterium]|nr:prolyl oligopeptidase family serine peptidase [candidate division KSB1 bacterium]
MKTAIQSRWFLLVILLLLLWLSTEECKAKDTYVAKIPHDGAPVAITSWLVAGMFPSPDLTYPSQDGHLRVGYTTDYLRSIGGEINARPRSGTAIKTADGKTARFTLHRWQTPYLDLNELYGWQSEVCAYIYAELQSDVTQTVHLHVGTNDAGKVWAGGRLIIAHPEDRLAEPSQNAAAVHLKPGRTPLLLKIDQAGGKWGAFVEIYGATEHQKLLDASSLEAVASVMQRFQHLCQKIKQPFALSGAQRDAYALALYYAQRLEKYSARLAVQDWLRERLEIPQRIASFERAVAYAEQGETPYTGKTGTFEAVYLSRVDGSAQPFMLVIPENYSPDSSYALLVELHGADRTHERTGEWWSHILQGDSPFKRKTIAVSVMGRGRFSGYRGLAEDDVLQVIQWIISHYPIDRDRVYLRGGSMGGMGTWRLAAQYPDIFAAAMVDCGGPDFRALPNFLNLPLYVNHGDIDWTVAIGYTRLGVELMQQQGSPVAYTEYPGIGHAVSYNTSADKSLLKLAAHVRSAEPSCIRIHASHPRYARMYWGAIEKWDDPHKIATLEARIFPNNIINVQLRNIKKARLQPPARHLSSGTDLIWLINGSRIAQSKCAEGSYDILIEDVKPLIREHAAVPTADRRPYVQGSIMNLYRGEPLTIIYGTHSADSSLLRSMRELATEVSRWLMPGEMPMEFGTIPTFSDTDASEMPLDETNLFLIGGPEQNTITKRLMALLPVAQHNGKLCIFNDEEIDLNGCGYGFVFPNPEHPSQLAFIYASYLPEYYSSRRGRLLQWEMSEIDPFIPDLIVEKIDTTFTNQIVRQCWFTHDWHVEAGSRQTIRHHPKTRREESEMSAEVFRRAGAASFAMTERARSDEPISYDSTTVSWSDLAARIYRLILFEVTGSELLELSAASADQWWMFSPAPDSSNIESEQLYRIAAPEYALWALAQICHYNPRNIQLITDSDKIETLFRSVWKVTKHRSLNK